MSMDKDILMRAAEGYAKKGKNREEKRKLKREFLKEAKKHENYKKTNSSIT